MTKKLTTYDPTADLRSEEAIAIFIAEAFKTNDACYISHAQGVVVRAKGNTAPAKALSVPGR